MWCLWRRGHSDVSERKANTTYFPLKRLVSCGSVPSTCVRSHGSARSCVCRIICVTRSAKGMKRAHICLQRATTALLFFFHNTKLWRTAMRFPLRFRCGWFKYFPHRKFCGKFNARVTQIVLGQRLAQRYTTEQQYNNIKNTRLFKIKLNSEICAIFKAHLVSKKNFMFYTRVWLRAIIERRTHTHT